MLSRIGYRDSWGIKNLLMRLLYTTVVLCLLAFGTNAQHAGKWGMYGSLQLTQVDRYTGFKGSIDVHWRQKHSVGLSLAWIERNSSNVPSDYDQYRPNYWFGSNDPMPDIYYIWTLSYGRYVQLTRDNKLRLHLRAGLSAGTYETAENYQIVYPASSGSGMGFNLGISSPHYVSDFVKRDLYGVSLNPSLEFAPGRGFGFTAGFIACINNERFCMAGEWGILFGLVRNRKGLLTNTKHP